MSESNFLTYKGKPLVRKGNEIYYGDMSEKYIVKFEILSSPDVLINKSTSGKSFVSRNNLKFSSFKLLMLKFFSSIRFIALIISSLPP